MAAFFNYTYTNTTVPSAGNSLTAVNIRRAVEVLSNNHAVDFDVENGEFIPQFHENQHLNKEEQNNEGKKVDLRKMIKW